MVKKILSIRGKVESVEPAKIPKIYLYRIASSKKDVEAAMEIHEDLKIADDGDKVALEVFEGKPRRISEKDFVGRGYLLKVIRENEKVKYVFSIGGFIMTLLMKEEVHELKADKEYYIRLQKL